MAILAATKDGAEDEGIAGDLHVGIPDVCAFVEVGALVTLAGTEEVAGHGVGGNLVQRARHAERTARHLDVAGAFDVTRLVAAVS